MPSGPTWTTAAASHLLPMPSFLPPSPPLQPEWASKGLADHVPLTHLPAPDVFIEDLLCAGHYALWDMCLSPVQFTS